MEVDETLSKDHEVLCTWADCLNQGTVPQLDRTGATWATLCNTHHVKLDAAVVAFDPKELLSAWVKANGGAKRAAAKHVDDISRTAEALMLGGRVNKR